MEDIGGVEEGEPLPIGMFVYQFVMGNLHNIMIDLATELNLSGTHVIPKETLQEKLMELPDEMEEGDENGSN